MENYSQKSACEFAMELNNLNCLRTSKKPQKSLSKCGWKKINKIRIV